MVATAEKYEKDEYGNQWFVVDNVPIFDEHVDHEGTRYDLALLKQIAANNNDRIEDTGDYCPIVEHHTDDKNDPKTDPGIVGLAGPFTVQKFGKKKPRWAIFAKFRIKPDKVELFKARPRRSVEIWPEEKPEQRYFDPIALLGAETPRRDLGLTYSRKGSGQPYRYSMGAAPSAPSGGNTFIPSTDLKKKKQYDKDSTMPMLDSDAISQIIEALKPVVQSMVDEANMGSGDDPLAGEPGLGDDLGMGPEDAGALPPAAPGPEDMPAPGGPMEAPGAPPIPEEDDEKDKGKALADQFMKRYGKGEDVDGGSQFVSAMDEGDAGAMEAYMKSCKDDAPEKQFYGKCCGKDKKMDAGTGGSDKYRKERDALATKYRKLEHEHAGLNRKYAKALEEIAEHKAEIIEQKKTARYAKRHGALSEMVMVEGIIMDVDDEMMEAASLNDEAFDKFCQVRRERYQKAPIGRIDQIENAIAKSTVQYDTSNEDADKYTNAATKYAQEHGKEHYTPALQYMKKNRTTKYIPQK